ncbi:MAG: ABC transporter substrate-binding protein [Anaerolineales bacterium]|nr:ABC transporter substrate-binding protein [Anaerolineales bacterium]
MRKNLRIIYIFLIVIVLVSACSPKVQVKPTNPPEKESTEIPATDLPTEEPVLASILITDDLGNEIELAGPAKTIISISPSLTEILYGVGAGDRLVGRDSNSQYPEEAIAAVDLGGMWDGIPVEDLLALEPDLILAGEIYAADAVQELRDLGLVVYWQKNPADFEGLFDNIRDIAILTGTEDIAEGLVQSLAERVAVLDEKLITVEESPLVFYELDASDPGNPYTPGASTFISYIISKAKGVNLGDSLAGEWVQISSEELIKQDPDFILLADALYGITPESVAERAGWNEINAVVDGDIYPFDPFILSVPGPRLVDGFEQVAEVLHPGIFED